MGWGLRIKKLVYYGGSLKNLILRIGSHKKYMWGNFSKKWGLGQFEDLRGGLAKKEGGAFEGDWYPNTCYVKLNHRLTGFLLGVKL